jgi:hypothetical protein
MLRILGDRRSLMVALTAHWLDQQLQLPPPVAPALTVIPATVRAAQRRPQKSDPTVAGSRLI